MDDTSSSQGMRLFVDMDGTLAVFTPVDTLETLYQYGYFANLAPIDNVVGAVKLIIKNHPEIEVSILSAYLTDSSHALVEKNQWLDEHLTEIDQSHRIFMPCGADKKDYIPGGLHPTDHLLDDYTHNLSLWEPPARGIKLLNGINDTHGTWKGQRIDCKQSSQELARDVVKTIYGQMLKQSEKAIENSKMEERIVRSNEYNRVWVEDLNYEEGEPEGDTMEQETFVEAKTAAVEQTQVAVQQHSVKSTASYRDRGGNGQVIQAIKQNFDILQYAQDQYGLHFKESSKGWLQCREYDSMYIDPVGQTFIRHSRGISGYIINMVAHLDEIPLNDAITKLRQEISFGAKPMQRHDYSAFRTKQNEKKPFVLPEKHTGKYSRLFGYLTHKRGIDPKVISALVKDNLLYESGQHHNCVFACKDYDGTTKAAMLRSTGTVKFAGEVVGGEKLGWIVNPNMKTMFIGEAPIDVMSVMTMIKMGRQDYNKYTYLATGGNPRHGMVSHHIQHNLNVTKIYLCHDNDAAGQALADKVAEELQSFGFKGEILRKLPMGKDFNDDLMQTVQALSPHNETKLKTQEVTVQCLTQE